MNIINTSQKLICCIFLDLLFLIPRELPFYYLELPHWNKILCGFFTTYSTIVLVLSSSYCIADESIFALEGRTLLIVLQSLVGTYILLSEFLKYRIRVSYVFLDSDRFDEDAIIILLSPRRH